MASYNVEITSASSATPDEAVLNQGANTRNMNEISTTPPPKHCLSPESYNTLDDEKTTMTQNLKPVEQQPDGLPSQYFMDRFKSAITKMEVCIAKNAEYRKRSAEEAEGKAHATTESA